MKNIYKKSSSILTMYTVLLLLTLIFSSACDNYREDFDSSINNVEILPTRTPIIDKSVTPTVTPKQITILKSPTQTPFDKSESDSPVNSAPTPTVTIQPNLETPISHTPTPITTQTSVEDVSTDFFQSPTQTPIRTPIHTPSPTLSQPISRLAFPGSDMESDMHDDEAGLKPKTTMYSQGAGFNNSQSLHVTGTPESNFYVFTSKETLNPPDGASLIVFYIKGTSNTKGFSINIGNIEQKQMFNSGTVTTEKTLTPSGSNSYKGSVQCKDWTRIALDISSIENIETCNLAFKIGKDSQWDLHLDNFHYE